MNTQIRLLRPQERPLTTALAWKTFLKFEAPVYSQEGIDTFYTFLFGPELEEGMNSGNILVWGYFDGDRLTGLVGMRKHNHICLVFVEEAEHKKGVGRKLMEYVLDFCRKEGNGPVVTLNSAPYAVGFYHRLGFQDTGAETLRDGIRFTPMKYIL